MAEKYSFESGDIPTLHQSEEQLSFIFAGTDGMEIFRITYDGKVVIGPKFQMDDAAKAFVEAVSIMYINNQNKLRGHVEMLQGTLRHILWEQKLNLDSCRNINKALKDTEEEE